MTYFTKHTCFVTHKICTDCHQHLRLNHCMFLISLHMLMNHFCTRRLRIDDCYSDSTALDHIWSLAISGCNSESSLHNFKISQC